MSSTQPDSLVKYGTAILVSTSIMGKKTVQKKGKGVAFPSLANSSKNEDYLNSILPPREYTESG
jgi:hypothetical protein